MQKMWHGISACSGCGVMLLVAIATGGCTLSPIRLAISHGQLKPVTQQRQGDLLVRPLIDKREQTQHIGKIVGSRTGGGPSRYFETRGEEKVDVLVTQYFVEALQHAGYNAVLDTATSGNALSRGKYDAVLTGEITEFWLDNYLNYPGFLCRMAVKVHAIDPADKTVLWEKYIQVGIGAIFDSFETLAGKAVTIVLDQAAWEFASDDFYLRVIRKQP